MVKEEAVNVIGRGYTLLVIGVLWYLIIEGALDFGKAFAALLVAIGFFLVLRGLVVSRYGEKRAG
ncbi:MAG: hypothetical protein QXY49_06895 [Thermofilaceae archaeon]